MEEIHEEAGGSDVNLEPQPVNSSCDASTQEGERTMDNEPTTSSSILLPERSQQETQKYEEEKSVVDPFLLTASYLVDVHASKVGVVSIFLNLTIVVFLLLNIICQQVTTRPHCNLFVIRARHFQKLKIICLVY